MVPDQQGREGGVPGAGADRRLAPERWTDETPTAVANADAIAAVPGIDSLLIGPHDLAMGLGIPGGFADEHIVAAQQKVCDACRVHGKFAAAGFVTDETLLRRYISMGGAAYPAGQRPQHDGACRDRDRCGNAHHL
jgi:hypothetical protein